MSSDATAPFTDCPIPIADAKEILMGHGSGGKLTARLVEELILPAFRNRFLEPLDDQALLPVGGGRVAFTTDSYVVTPLFFPGGDIGELAVNGTVNDLAVGGARPLFLSLAFILEEGLPLAELERVIASVRRAAEAADVLVVTGDTKVVNRGKGDKLFVNTAGIGVPLPGASLSSRRVAPGDAVLLSGPIGDHGVAILSQREGIAFGGDVRSDTAPLHRLIAAVLEAFPDVHAMRDPTRGGVAATLVEIASRARVGVEVDERAIPVRDAVRGACELLGLDPLLVANEGKVVAFVPEEGAARALDAMRSDPLGREAARIGTVTGEHRGMVTLRTPIGGRRILDLPFGEALPRIC
ncbi:hydrogenase expression/formation protein HypE [Anaeromyxobacter oryzae]|uniref:Hydrogenase expression/formation protein HypE n=1 Tax=Anaeromyxobacter oryzae TaxID=2918170 RepID=A0ABN6MNX0_9BACT|nr:hydrogenase expression/formation protein HypE [Anaeromyxobacter oryzae]BDG01383.1 hydrogenase expression/formation protein HypE [Anaeromyxobacter oryzae]